MFDVSWVLTFLVAVVTWYLANHWMKTRSLPPGPFPLPIVGNLLSMRKRSLKESMDMYHSQYGGIFTLWIGRIPYVIVMENQLIRQALLEKRDDFSGRPEIPIVRKILKYELNIASVDYSRPWEILRKMGHAAIRKYAIGDRLPGVIDELTEEIVKQMIEQKEPFNPKVYIHNLVFNISASTVLGERFAHDDPLLTNFRKAVALFQKYVNRGIMGHFIPILQPFLKSNEISMVETVKRIREFVEGKMKESIDTYQPTTTRHMIDSMLHSRENLLKELGQENTNFLSDGNIFQFIMDMFTVGIDTTNIAIRWVVLYAAMRPDIQEKIIKEIQENIGDRVPIQDDRKRCPYTMATIIESMRVQAVAPLGIPHKTLKDTKIGDMTIPKGTAVMFNYGAVHMDPKLWQNPETFHPERFIKSDGQLNDARVNQYMAFGLGRRSCIGEKLATEDMFLVIAGIFRRCRLTLENPPESLDSETILFQIPKAHTLLATRLVT